MSLKQDISGHESLGSTLPSLSMNTQPKRGKRTEKRGLKCSGKLSINKTKTMDIISLTFPILTHPYIHNLWKKNHILWRPNWKSVTVSLYNMVGFGVEQLTPRRHQHLCTLSPETWVHCSLGWSDVSLTSLLENISLEDFNQITGPFATGKHTLPQRSQFCSQFWNSWGISRVCFIDGKLKIKVKVLEAVRGRGLGKTAAVQTG